MAEQAIRQATIDRYSYLWNAVDHQGNAESSHYRRLQALLPPGHLHGLVLDAGCGPGIDTAHMAQDGASAVVALDPSPGGIAQTRRRTGSCRNVCVVQGCLEALPFPDEVFDVVYCYGVLHHLARPSLGFRELVRTLKPQGLMAIYVYEDFRTHAVLERLLLRIVSGIRVLTVRCRPRWLHHACRLAAPAVYLGCTLPARGLARMPFTRRVSQRIPFRHATSIRGLVGDLYDRFATPLEHRYSQEEVQRWFTTAALSDIRIVAHRGWLAYARKPATA